NAYSKRAEVTIPSLDDLGGTIQKQCPTHGATQSVAGGFPKFERAVCWAMLIDQFRLYGRRDDRFLSTLTAGGCWEMLARFGAGKSHDARFSSLPHISLSLKPCNRSVFGTEAAVGIGPLPNVADSRVGLSHSCSADVEEA